MDSNARNCDVNDESRVDLLHDANNDVIKNNGSKNGVASTTTDKDVEQAGIGEKQNAEPKVVIEDSGRHQPLIYRINESPPIHMLFMFALQQALLMIIAPLNVTVIGSEILCSQQDDLLKLQILSANFVTMGIASFVMSTFGIRLPICQGPAAAYLIPLLAMSSMDEWKCPEPFSEVDPVTNRSVLMVETGNGTFMTARNLSLVRLEFLSGSLLVASIFHILVGVTGLVGVLCRYIGPVTIVPTILLIALHVFKIVVKFAEPHMGITIVVVFFNLLFSLLLGRRKTPIPWWSRDRGFHIMWYPFHLVFSLLISLLIGWSLSAILTMSGAFSDDANSKEYLARTDAKDYVLERTDWIILFYPGKFGGMRFNAGIFINFLIASIISVLDSIGDYAACAKVTRVTPPPPYAFNRGIFVEGLLSILSSTAGCCVATVSYGANIGAIGISRVASRRVFQTLGLIYVVFGVVGKVGAVFITIPYPVLGGTTLITIGIFSGVVISYLQTVDMTSTRNIAIVGIALLLGLVVPYWVERNTGVINTGHESLDGIIKMLLANPSFVGGVFSCTMDNFVPATLKERGLLNQLKDLDDQDAKETAKNYDDGPEVYRLPWIPDNFRRTRLARIVPIFDCDK